MKRDDHKATPGTMSTRKERSTQRRCAGRGSRAMANPAQEAVSTVRGTAAATTNNEFSV